MQWFQLYTAEAGGGAGHVITMAAGDSVGATPPISNFFGDTPAIESMNMMGFDIDGLGNHNFDRGAAYLRNTLIPLATFPFVSANVRTRSGNADRVEDVARVSSREASRSASSASRTTTRRR